MIYITGDIHGRVDRIVKFAKQNDLTTNDVIIILGDAGLNYHENAEDKSKKTRLTKIKPIIFCIHGNHEIRPKHIKSYKLRSKFGGKVWIEDKYPNIMFAKDGDIYNIQDHKFLVLGGAYSIDKYYRLSTGLRWFCDEQPSHQIKHYVKKQLDKISNKIEIVLSHTCPLKYEPVEVFIPGINQKTVDKSTEKWLDEIESKLDYDRWFCGHFHTNKHVDKIDFLFENFIKIQ